MSKPKILFFIASLIPTETDSRVAAQQFKDADVQFRYKTAAEIAPVEACDGVFGSVPANYATKKPAYAVMAAYRATPPVAQVVAPFDDAPAEKPAK